MQTMDDAQEDTAPESEPIKPAKPARRRRGGWLIALVIIIIVLVAAWFGWQWWQQQRAASAASQQHAQQNMQALTSVHADVDTLHSQLDTLESQLDKLHKQTRALGQRVSASADSDDGLRQQLQGLLQRTTQLEAAVAKLSQQRLSGRDAGLVDDTAMLLRLGQQRYELFHDAASAEKAYTLAAQTLGAVNDPAYASVGQSIASERQALADTHPQARINALARLQQMRAHWSELPLKSLDNGANTAPHTTWQRVWHALSTLVKIDHYSAQSPNARHDPAMARTLAQLDLVQAQASLLASDMPSYRAALQLLQAELQEHFEHGDAGVRKAETTLKQLLDNAAADSTPVRLGTALRELENLRAVHGVAPDSDAGMAPAAPLPTPAPAATSSVPPAAASVPAPASTAATPGGGTV